MIANGLLLEEKLSSECETDEVSHVKSNFLILFGYNRFIGYPVNPEIPEASIDMPEENLETTILTVTPPDECII